MFPRGNDDVLDPRSQRSGGFRNLQVLDVSRCPGVTDLNLLWFLAHVVGVDRRPKDMRLDKLGLAGCDVDPQRLPRLDDFVRHTRDPEKPFAESPFDVWRCVHYMVCRNVTDEEGRRCVNCKSVTCPECSARFGEFLCKVDPGCRTYLCCVGDCNDYDRTEIQTDDVCPGCGLEMCFGCMRICTGDYFNSNNDDDVPGLNNHPGCGQEICGECSWKTEQIWTSCYTCEALWCGECVPWDHLFACIGNGRVVNVEPGSSEREPCCYKVHCADCEQKDGMGFVRCSGKGCTTGEFHRGEWCGDCAPESARSLPPGGEFVCDVCVEEDETAVKKAARLTRLEKQLRI